MIDSHHHFWQYHPIKDAWITDEMALLKQDFMPTVFANILSANGITGSVLVQADQSEKETNFLLKIANEHNFIKGIVGWIDFKAPDLIDRLKYFSQFKIIKGWRHILQAEPKGFMLDMAFLNGIEALKPFNYTYDILIQHHQLAEAIQMINRFPTQSFVLDHCAKPSIKKAEIAQWTIDMKQIAKFDNVHCKLSGLLTEADWENWQKKEIYSYFDVIFDCFGTTKVMFGSDWPVMLLAGKYQDWMSLVEEYISRFTLEEQYKIMHDNAVNFYQL